MVAIQTGREWLSVKEFASKHRLSQSFVYESAQAGTILSVKVGGKVLIASDAFDVLAEARTAGQVDSYPEVA